MVHLDEAEAAPGRASGAGGASGDASDAGYAQRTDKAWRDQLSSAQAANTGLDENDVDALELYGEQAVHNFPDVHNDWSDARARAVRAARIRAIVDISPDSGGLSASLEPSGWNTAYRAGLENALDAVRDSKQMMRNLRTIRRRQKDMDEGVEIGHLKGKTAKEANAEWEKQRLEARDAERRRRVAAAELAAANARATEESKKSVKSGLPSLPDFLKRSDAADADGEGAEAAARALAAKHGEWIRTLEGEGGMETKDTEAKERQERQERRTSSASADSSDVDASTPTKVTKPLGAKPASRDDESAESLTADHREESLTESLTNEEDTESSFFENLTSLSPLRRASRAKTDRDEDFWNREMWGGDDFDADGEIESAEAEMAKLCAAEISGARRLSVGEE